MHVAHHLMLLHPHIHKPLSSYYTFCVVHSLRITTSPLLYTPCISTFWLLVSKACLCWLHFFVSDTELIYQSQGEVDMTENYVQWYTGDIFELSLEQEISTSDLTLMTLPHDDDWMYTCLIKDETQQHVVDHLCMQVHCIAMISGLSVKISVGQHIHLIFEPSNL